LSASEGDPQAVVLWGGGERNSPLPDCVPGTAHVLRVSLQFSIIEVKASPKPSQMEAKGIVLSRDLGSNLDYYNKA